MGRRRNRKRERRWEQQPGGRAWDEPKAHIAPATHEENRSLLLSMSVHDAPAAAPAKTCGTCREFIEDQEAGRGTCLHPGSGVLSPWTDTPACGFHDRVRQANGRR